MQYPLRDIGLFFTEWDGFNRKSYKTTDNSHYVLISTAVPT